MEFNYFFSNRYSLCTILGKGAPEPGTLEVKIPVKDLPACESCGGLLRPHIVWFGESLEDDVLDSAFKEYDKCDLCLVVGTSSIVYPAAMFAPKVQKWLNLAIILRLSVPYTANSLLIWWKHKVIITKRSVKLLSLPNKIKLL